MEDSDEHKHLSKTHPEIGFFMRKINELLNRLHSFHLEMLHKQAARNEVKEEKKDFTQ